MVKKIISLGVVMILLFAGGVLAGCGDNSYRYCAECDKEECVCCEICRREPCICEESDFLLVISVEERERMKGESFLVNVELRNISGENLYITWQYGFMRVLYSWTYFPHGVEYDPPSFQTEFLEDGSSLKNVGFRGGRGSLMPFHIGNHLPRGIHELYFTFRFYSNIQQENLINSNIVRLRVL